MTRGRQDSRTPHGKVALAALSGVVVGWTAGSALVIAGVIP